MVPPDEGTGGAPVRAGRLRSERSAYLRGAAEQPIDWFPWGPEPFELARRTNRPVLLDIGAVWCHWCHVMDEGTYADLEVARLLRQHFVAVKVDRDERPEVDRRYQRQVSALTGQGGWPLTAFLTPAGEAFLGGTYFPPEDGLGRPGFRRVLKEVARIWRDEPDKAQGNVRAIAETLERHHGHRPAGAIRSYDAFYTGVIASIQQSYDGVHGGFGFAPKFPHPTAVSLLLYDGLARGDRRSTDQALETLRRMADSGLYDQLGGGFHRYATDEGWHIPHFEKMAADNAALLLACVEGARRSGEVRLEEAVRGTLGWIESVLGDPSGGWGASQDADNAPGDDGSYFTWSRAELKAALEPDELRLISRYYGIGSDGRMPHDPDRNVLFRLLPLHEAAAGIVEGVEAASQMLRRAEEKLRVVRGRRPTPFIDRALYADLNGSFLRGVSAAAELTEELRTQDRACAAADRFLADAYDADRGIAHGLGSDGPHGFGHLEDQAMFSLGLLDLAAVTTRPSYVAAADRLLELVFAEYPGPDGILRDVAPRLYDGPSIGPLAEPAYPVEDNPHLAANAAVAIACLRRAAIGEEERWIDRARGLVARLVPRVEGAGLFAAGTALAVGLLETPPARVVVEGTGPKAAELLRAARRSWHPNRIVFAGTPPEPFGLPGEVGAGSGEHGARALVCFGTRCLAPVTEPAALGELIARGGRDGA